MKTRLFVLVILFIFCFLSQSKSQESHENEFISVGDYCNFLNELGGDNAIYLYDPVGLGTTSYQKNSIQRLGEPGTYHYEVIDSEKERAVSFVSYEDIEAYSAWKRESNMPNCKASYDLSFIDEKLKSNRLVFYSQDKSLQAHKANGEVITESIIKDILEAVFFIAGSGDIITREPVFGREDFQVNTDENEEITQLVVNSSFSQIRENSKLDLNGNPANEWFREIDNQEQGHYEVVNQMWHGYSRKWTQWVLARKNLKSKEEALRKIEQEVQEERDALNNQDLTKTYLGKFIKGCDDVTSIAEYGPALHGFNPIALASKGASVLAVRFQEALRETSKQRIEEKMGKAIQDIAIAKSEADLVLQQILGQDPQPTEEIARAKEIEKIMKAAEELMSRFSNNPQSKKAWEKKMNAYDQEVFNQGIKSVERLAPLKFAYQQAEEIRDQRREAQERVEAASYSRILARRVLDGVIAETEGESLLLRSNQAVILEASRYHDKAQQTEQELQYSFEKIKLLHPKIEEKAKRLYEEYHNAKEALALELDRTKVRAEAYHAAWRKHWPQEALTSETILGGKYWEKALKNNQEINWETIIRQASVLRDLGNVEEEWKKREEIAKVKIAFLHFKKVSSSFFKKMTSFEFRSQITEELREELTLNRKQLEKVIKELKPVSEEVAKRFELTSELLSDLQRVISTPGWKSVFKEKLKGEAKKEENFLDWKKEIDWIKEVEKEIKKMLFPEEKEEAKNNTPGKLSKVESSYGAFLEFTPRGVQIRYNNNSEAKEKKELEELSKLKKTSKVLQQKVKQLRSQVTFQVAERSRVEALQKKSLAEIAEIAKKAEIQNQLFEKRESILKREAAALKGSSEIIRKQKEMELEKLREDREAFEKEQERKLHSILKALKEQSEVLKIQEEELALSEKTLEEVIEQDELTIEELQKQLQAAKEEIEKKEVAKKTAEENIVQVEERATRAESQVAVLLKEKEIVQKETEDALAEKMQTEEELIKQGAEMQNEIMLLRKELAMANRKIQENDIWEQAEEASREGEFIFKYAAHVKTEEGWLQAEEKAKVLEVVWIEACGVYQKFFSENENQLSQEEKAKFFPKIEKAKMKARDWEKKFLLSESKILLLKPKLLGVNFLRLLLSLGTILMNII